jgi:hypothetical protein
MGDIKDLDRLARAMGYSGKGARTPGVSLAHDVNSMASRPDEIPDVLNQMMEERKVQIGDREKNEISMIIRKSHPYVRTMHGGRTKRKSKKRKYTKKRRKSKRKKKKRSKRR